MNTHMKISSELEKIIWSWWKNRKNIKDSITAKSTKWTNFIQLLIRNYKTTFPYEQWLIQIVAWRGYTPLLALFFAFYVFFTLLRYTPIKNSWICNKLGITEQREYFIQRCVRFSILEEMVIFARRLPMADQSGDPTYQILNW